MVALRDCPGCAERRAKIAAWLKSFKMPHAIKPPQRMTAEEAAAKVAKLKGQGHGS